MSISICCPFCLRSLPLQAASRRCLQTVLSSSLGHDSHCGCLFCLVYSVETACYTMLNNNQHNEPKPLALAVKLVGRKRFDKHALGLTLEPWARRSEPAGRSLCFPDGRGALASHPPHCGYYAATCGGDDSRGNWLEILIDPYEEREPNSLSSHLKIRVRPPGH